MDFYMKHSAHRRDFSCFVADSTWDEIPRTVCHYYMKISFIIAACLTSAIIFTSCVAVKPGDGPTHEAYRSDNYILYKLENDTSIAELAKRYLGDEQ